jgi:predicted metal-binding membrane protein
MAALAQVRGFVRRPAAAAEIGVFVAWLGLAAASGEVLPGSQAAGSGFGAGGPLWLCMPGMAAGDGGVVMSGGGLSYAGTLGAMAPMWALMAVAMMLPAALPAVRHVAVNSLYWRRRRAVAEFVLVFLGVWILFGVLVLGALAGWPAAGSAFALVAALAIAAVWQLTPLKARALRACHDSEPLPPYGWRASAGVARFGLRNGSACLASCWALMLTMAAAGSARLAWMAALTAIVVVEKVSLKPRRTARRVALALAALASIALATALLSRAGG